jgi:ParB family chromosome partitioning protein
LVVQNIELTKIKDNPFNPRSHYNPEKVKELASSIKQVGLIEVPQARAAKGGFYELAYGGYRRRAYEHLAKEQAKNVKHVTEAKIWDEMPLKIEPLTDEQMAIFGLEENLKRHDMTPLDTARDVEQYLTIFPKVTEAQLAEKMSMTQGNISNMRRVLKLPGKVLEKVNEDKINFAMARELCLLQGLKSDRGRYGSAQVSDDEALMMEAIRGCTGQYSKPTVNGIKESIYGVVSGHFTCLDKDSGSYYGDKTLFDTKAANCMKCEKMLKVNRTQSQIQHYCTDPKCWDKYQTAHKKKAAEEANAKMTSDLAKRVLAETEQRKEKPAKQDISQEISDKKAPAAAAAPVTDPAETLLTKAEVKILEQAQQVDAGTDASSEAIQARQRRQQLANIPDHPCLKCVNIGRCDGRVFRQNYDQEQKKYIYTCEKQILTAPEKITEKAVVKLPPSLLDKIKDKAGTRAVILDMHELKLGNYNAEMKKGHVWLDQVLSSMANPAECTETCTTGFHFAFDSKDTNGRTYFVCTTPECCSKKKAEFTRAKNARGMLRKKAELEAIKQVAKEATSLGIPQVKLIFFASVAGKHIEEGYGSKETAASWLFNKLKIKDFKCNEYDRDRKIKIGLAILKALDKIPFKEMLELLMEFMLHQFTYTGETKDYRIETTEALKLFHVSVQVPKEGEEPPNPGKNKTMVPTNDESEEGGLDDESENENDDE